MILVSSTIYLSGKSRAILGVLFILILEVFFFHPPEWEHFPVTCTLSSVGVHMDGMAVQHAGENQLPLVSKHERLGQSSICGYWDWEG